MYSYAMRVCLTAAIAMTRAASGHRSASADNATAYHGWGDGRGASGIAVALFVDMSRGAPDAAYARRAVEEPGSVSSPGSRE
jgi:hypothetical protein